jgi:hypothetical protein
MDFVLTRAGLTLLAAEPLFLLPRSPFDMSGLWSSRRLLQRLAAHNSRS